MKRLVFIGVFLLFSSFLPAQSRTNAELARVIDTGKEFVDFTGWYRNEAGQWRTTGILTTEFLYRGISYFNKLKIYSIEYKNKQYILFEIVIHDWDYEYPTIREGRYYYRKSHFYIIENENFTWRIKENEVIKNQIQVFSYFENSERWLKMFRYIPIDSLRELVTSSIERTNTRNEAGLRASLYDGYVEKPLDILTFYYKDDNVVRFYFCDYNTDTLPENYYFECSFEHFINFFKPVVEE
jgi:hypothetical protein